MDRFNFGSCGEKSRNRIIVCEEKKRKFVGLNDEGKSIIKIKVDGCLEIKGKKCDWLLIADEKNTAYFIELKGSEVRHAVEQLEHTIKLIANSRNKYISIAFSGINAYIIASRFPKESVFIQREKKNFLKKYNTRLIIKNREVRETI